MKKFLILMLFFLSICQFNYSQITTVEFEKKEILILDDSSVIKEIKTDSKIDKSVIDLLSVDSVSNDNLDECVYIIPDFSKLTCFGDRYDSTTFTKLSQSPPVGTRILASDTMVRIFVVVVDSTSKINTGCFNVKVSCNKVVYVPQFLSPNNDGANDTWEIPELIGFHKNRIKLFDKYGKMIADLKNYEGGWNGVSNILKTENGENVEIPDGQYVYTIDLEEDKSSEKKSKPLYGCLTIKR